MLLVVENHEKSDDANHPGHILQEPDNPVSECPAGGQLNEDLLHVPIPPFVSASSITSSLFEF